MLSLSISPTQRAMDQHHFHPFQMLPQLLAGGEPPSPADGEAYLHSVCSGLTFHTCLPLGGSSDPALVAQNPPLKRPKIEPQLADDDRLFSVQSPAYNFFTDTTLSSFPCQLPSLLSYEQPQKKIPIPNPRSGTTRQWYRKQQRLSEKTRSLQKLLPCDEKMDMATVLEEAYKYIKFLLAQVSVLQSMPCENGAGSVADGTAMEKSGGDLWRLNRQQVLQVVLNSPLAQTQLYSKGCCVYSWEQLVWLKKKAEKKGLYDEMVLGSSGNRNSFHC